jgi:hypothetical protein
MGLDKCTADPRSGAARLPIWQVGLICRDRSMAWVGVVWGALAGLTPSTCCACSGEAGGFDLRRGNALMDLGLFGIFGDIGRGLRERSGFVLRHLDKLGAGRRAGMLL